MTRTLIILCKGSAKSESAEFYYGNGLNKCGEDYIDELKPQIGESIDHVRGRLLGRGYNLSGGGFDYDTPIGDCLLVWLDSIHIIGVDEDGLVEFVETLRKHDDSI